MLNRFSSVTVGLSVPVFAKVQKQKVTAAKANEEVAVATTKAATVQMQTKLYRAWQDYEKFSKAVLYYEKTAIRQSDIIINTANLNYKNGQINYIEWGMLLNQALAIKSQYIEALRQLSIAESELNYLFNNYRCCFSDFGSCWRVRFNNCGCLITTSDGNRFSFS